ncbi:FGLLP motif-containing membrane protein [Amycolatopsis sp. NPDC102389]|uniref:FGLLP motif-containing membrane protein n=1 Tax=Amycolatopsis sp. NPDC102389 TaxID=3363941 RepID=UPI00381123CD
MKRTLALSIAGLGVFLNLAAAPATAVDDSFVFSSGQASKGWFTVDVLANDTPRDTRVRAVELVSGPADGVVEPTTNPVGFRWRRGSSPTARWSYRIVDSAGVRSNTAAVSVGVRTGPHPRDDSFQATSGVLLKVPAPGVLAGDTHPDGERLTAEATVRNGVTARGGRVVLRPDGSFDYAPPLDFTGTDSFGYRVVDPQNDAADATVTVTVRPRTTAPAPSLSPNGDLPSGRPEVTVHLHGYPAGCRAGSIVVGGRRVDTWLDEARQGRGGAAGWEFIDLHAFLPDGLAAGVRPVEFRCGATTYPAGTMRLPAGPGLTTFELTWKQKPATTTPPQPTTEPPGSPAPPSEPPEPKPPGILYIPVPGEVLTDLRSLVASAVDAAAIISLVLLLETAFPADLVNKIIEALRTPRTLERLKAAPRPGHAWLRTLGYAAIGGVLLVWADAEIRAGTWDWGVVALKAAAGAVSLALVVAAYEKPKDSLLSTGRGRGHLRAVWLGFLVAAVLATLSRLSGSPVPYVYGLVVTFFAVGAVSKRAQGRATLGGGIAVLVTCVGLWAALAPLVVAGREASPKSMTYAIAFAVCVVLAAGIQVVVFGLLPIKPLDGYALKDWSKVAWWALYAPAVFFYVHVVLNSVHPAVDEGPSTERIFVASCLFVLASVASFLLRRLKGVSEDRRGPPPDFS